MTDPTPEETEYLRARMRGDGTEDQAAQAISPEAREAIDQRVEEEPY